MSYFNKYLKQYVPYSSKIHNTIIMMGEKIKLNIFSSVCFLILINVPLLCVFFSYTTQIDNKILYYLL